MKDLEVIKFLKQELCLKRLVNVKVVPIYNVYDEGTGALILCNHYNKKSEQNETTKQTA